MEKDILQKEETRLMRNDRNTGIDFLRLVLIFMVCILHILSHGGVLEMCSKGSISFNVFWFIEVCAYCAVDGFAIISGYVSSGRPTKWDKLVSMWFQVFFYSAILTVMLHMMKIGIDLDTKTWIKQFMPVSFQVFWYFSGYVALCFVKPVLDQYVLSVNATTARKALVIIICLFSLTGVIADPFSIQAGYSALWIMILYCFGALAKKAELFTRTPSVLLIVLFLVDAMASWGAFILLGTERLISYVSPTILLNAFILVVLFSRIKMKRQLVRTTSSFAFGIYLFQLNITIWNDVIHDNFAWIAEQSLVVGIGCLVLCASILFIIGLVIEFLRDRMARLLRILILSQKIAKGLEQGLVKAMTALDSFGLFR